MTAVIHNYARMHARLVAVLLTASSLVGLDALGQARIAQAESTAIVLKVGSKKVLGVPDIARVAVGNPEVADIRVSGSSQIELTGRAEGSTTVHVWSHGGQKVTWSVTVSR